MEKSVENNKKGRMLYEAIVEFVETWHTVIEKKSLELDEKDEETKKALKEKNMKRGNPFKYIYNKIKLDKDGNVEPYTGGSGRKRHNEYPIATDICEYFYDHMPESYRKKEVLASNIRRILTNLPDGRIQKVGMTYRPATISYKRKYIAPMLADFDSIDEKMYFPVSKTTYIIYFTHRNLNREKRFFEDFIDKDLFDIIQIDNKLVLLLKGNLEKCNEVGTLIKSTVKQAYNMQMEKRNSKNLF